jgi:tRNA(Ile)-lysidine synthase
VLEKFGSNILKNQLFNAEHKLLLAISGGVDSVVLAHLLKKSGFSFSMAHCNFQLRDTDSEGDERFCKALAKKLDVPFFTKRFNVDKQCREHRQSIQMAARQLRYDWFNELLNEQNIDVIATAHHASDTLETVFINLLRGTGIKGLKGIPVKNGKIVRPLLNVTKDEIASYAKENKLKFRTDKSNLEDKYERNFLRLNIIPKLKELNPNLEKTFLENAFRFTQEDAIVTDFLEAKAKQLKQENAGLIIIDKAKLKKEKYGESILHFLVSPYGFNRAQQRNMLKNIVTGSTIGKRFISPEFELTIAKTGLIIQPVSENKFEPVIIRSLKELKAQPVFKTEPLNAFILPGKNELVITAASFFFPLTIRTKQTGDKFKPFGMKGFKLVSDLFKEEKLNAFEKESCKLLVNGNGEIIWVVGYRSDERYKVNKTDHDLLKLTIIE